eukprot:Gb_02932 [translate_table: standard]
MLPMASKKIVAGRTCLRLEHCWLLLELISILQGNSAGSMVLFDSLKPARSLSYFWQPLFHWKRQTDNDRMDTDLLFLRCPLPIQSLLEPPRYENIILIMDMEFQTGRAVRAIKAKILIIAFGMRGAYTMDYKASLRNFMELAVLVSWILAIPFLAGLTHLTTLRESHLAQWFSTQHPQPACGTCNNSAVDGSRSR